MVGDGELAAELRLAPLERLELVVDALLVGGDLLGLVGASGGRGRRLGLVDGDTTPPPSDTSASACSPTSVASSSAAATSSVTSASAIVGGAASASATSTREAFLRRRCGPEGADELIGGVDKGTVDPQQAASPTRRTRRYPWKIAPKSGFGEKNAHTEGKVGGRGA